MSALHARLRRFAADEDGVTLVELAIVLPLFLLIFLGLIDFGRMGHEYVLAEKAMQLAARTAAVRPAACAGVPEFNVRGSGLQAGLPPRYGTLCSAGSNFCVAVAEVTCTGSAANPTAAEVWARVEPAMPSYATVANLRFRYTYDQRLGFVGGPYVPIVTVEIQNLNFQFVTPLAGLAGLATSGASNGVGPTFPFPRMSVSLPAEDLAQGVSG